MFNYVHYIKYPVVAKRKITAVAFERQVKTAMIMIVFDSEETINI